MNSFVDSIKWFYKRKSERKIYHYDHDHSGDVGGDGVDGGFGNGGSGDGGFGGGGGSDGGGIGGYYDVTDHDDVSQDNRCCR